MVEKATEEEMQRAAMAMVGYAIQELGKGRSPPDVERDFVDKGLNQEVASLIVQRAITARQEEAQKHDPIYAKMHAGLPQGSSGGAGGADMAIGATICVIGIVITAATYSAASGGGTYVVAWGAIIFGAVRFFKGLASS